MLHKPTVCGSIFHVKNLLISLVLLREHMVYLWRKKQYVRVCAVYINGMLIPL